MKVHHKKKTLKADKATSTMGGPDGDFKLQTIRMGKANKVKASAASASASTASASTASASTASTASTQTKTYGIRITEDGQVDRYCHGCCGFAMRCVWCDEKYDPDRVNWVAEPEDIWDPSPMR